SLVEGTERHREFRAADRGLRVAGVRLLQDRIYRRPEIVTAPAGSGPEPVGPARRILRIDADVALADMVDKSVGQEQALRGVAQADIDDVIAGLHAEKGFGGTAE